MSRKYVVVDFETTGNSPAKGDRIIQIGAVVVEDGEIKERFSTFVKPDVPIPPFIEQLTGINEEMVKDAPTFEEAVPKLLQLMDGGFFVAHNVMFDYSFLQGELDRAGYSPLAMPLLDTVELSRILLLDAEGYQLNQLAEYLGLNHDNPHQADSDAAVTAQLLLHLLNQLNGLPLLTLQRLEPFCKKFQSSLEPILMEMIDVKTRMAESSLDESMDFYRQLALKAFQKKGTEEASVSRDVSAAAEIRDKLKAHMAHFEVRDSQKKMMDLVEYSLNSNQHAVIEAGTGVGKSLGYLIPGLLHAKKEDRPFVVSTHTIQLQQQLLERDVPLLKKIMPFSFDATVLKGRNHYLCLRKFEHSLDDTLEDNYDTNLTKAQLIVWLTQTDQGDVEELNLASGGKLLWHQVKSDANSCLNHRCPWFSRCYYHRKRRAAHESDLVITNHALMFTDVKSESQLLPAYKEAVIDEAHHLEEVVSDHFGTQTDYFSFYRLLDRIGVLEGKTMSKQLSELSDLLEIPSGKTVFDNWDTVFNDSKAELDELFKQLKGVCLKQAKSSDADTGKVLIRYSNEDVKGKNWEHILEIAGRAEAMILDLTKKLKKALKEIQDKEDHLNFQQKAFIVDMEGLKTELADEWKKLEHVITCPDPQEVYWMEAEVRGAKNAVWLNAKPVEIADLLADEFFAKKNSIILTSATLSVRNSFKYIIERLGLTDFGPVFAQLPSPFRYHEQARLMIPTDLPLINEVDSVTFTDVIAKSLYQIAKASKGRMLVLFTSYEMLRQAHSVFKELMQNDEFVLLAQGIDSGSRARLTKNFKRFERAILFGTSSFWEGIDIPGEALTCLVIIRLPFTPPDNPVMAARSERLKKTGGNAFYDLSLPQAIIRFKQGFGRLVRSSRDYGAVFVFDKRIVETRYGKSFISSLPQLPIDQRPLSDLARNLQEWLDSKE